MIGFNKLFFNKLTKLRVLLFSSIIMLQLNFHSLAWYKASQHKASAQNIRIQTLPNARHVFEPDSLAPVWTGLLRTFIHYSNVFASCPRAIDGAGYFPAHLSCILLWRVVYMRREASIYTACSLSTTKEIRTFVWQNTFSYLYIFFYAVCFILQFK